MRVRHRIATCLLAGLAALAAARPAFAGRLLTVTVENKGALVLQSSYRDTGGPVSSAWWHLQARPAWSLRLSPVKANPDDPLRADLRGKASITLSGDGYLHMVADLEGLALKRSSADSEKWFLPPEEVERVLRAVPAETLSPARSTGAEDRPGARRRITARVTVDSALALVAEYEDDGKAPPEAVWRYLGREPLRARLPVSLRSSPDTPGRATVRGDILIRVYRGGTSGRVLAQARVPELTLVRRDGYWALTPEEADRTARVAGLPGITPPPPSEDERLLRATVRTALVLGGVVAVGLVGALAWFLVKRRRRRLA
jgi:hypothetical protein